MTTLSECCVDKLLKKNTTRVAGAHLVHIMYAGFAGTEGRRYEISVGDNKTMGRIGH